MTKDFLTNGFIGCGPGQTHCAARRHDAFSFSMVKSLFSVHNPTIAQKCDLR